MVQIGKSGSITGTRFWGRGRDGGDVVPACAPDGGLKRGARRNLFNISAVEPRIKFDQNSSRDT